jgi:hypothetical protein
MDIIVTLTQGEFEILESWLGIGEVQSWIQHALDNKIRQRTDASILECTDRNPNKMNKQAKLELLKGVVLPTRVERDKGE